MQSIKIKIKAAPNVKIPEYKTIGSAGADVSAYLPSSTGSTGSPTAPTSTGSAGSPTPTSAAITLRPLERALIPTGLYFEIPEGFEIQVRPRSGLAIKNGVTCLNTPGTIDSDYRGELKIILINLGSEDFKIENGDRIAQIVVAPVTRGDFEIVPEINETKRGSGGFGSTGV